MFLFLISAHFFGTKEEGWHFYHDSISEKEKPKTMAQLKKQLHVLLDEAIWNPTPRNVLRYMQLQKLLMDKSQQFSAAWERVLITHPELDPTVKNPTSYYGTLHARKTKEKINREQLKKRMHDYVLFLVVKDDDEMSEALTTVVQDMATYRGYHVTIVPGQGQSQRLVEFGIERLPALLMIHVPTGKRFVLTYGLIGADKIEERMIEVINTAP